MHEERHIAKYVINSVDRSKVSELGIFKILLNLMKVSDNHRVVRPDLPILRKKGFCLFYMSNNSNLKLWSEALLFENINISYAVQALISSSSFYI